MKYLAKLTVLTLLCAASLLVLITACGGGNGTGGTGTGGGGQTGFVFISSPAHLATLLKAGSHALAESANPFAVRSVHAAVTTGSGNLQGVCSAVAPSGGRAATAIFNLGRWSSGECDDASTPDSDIGVALPAAGQLGNLKVDAVGNGSSADSGLIEISVIPVSGSRSIKSLTCSLGASAVEAKVHCEDLASGHFISVNAGDQIVARFWYNAGDSYRGIRVNLDYGAPTL